MVGQHAELLRFEEGGVANVFHKMPPSWQVAKAGTARLLDDKDMSEACRNMGQYEDPDSQSIHHQRRISSLNLTCVITTKHLVAIQLPLATQRFAESPNGAYQYLWEPEMLIHEKLLQSGAMKRTLRGPSRSTDTRQSLGTFNSTYTNTPYHI